MVRTKDADGFFTSKLNEVTPNRDVTFHPYFTTGRRGKCTQYAFVLATLIALVHFSTVSAADAGYALVDDFSHENFFPNFELFDGTDPTEGFVQYQAIEDAVKNEYIEYLNESTCLGVNYKDRTPNGRPSIRVEGKKQYNQGLMIMDIAHMPDSDEWRKGGEIDIIEGVNDASNNAATLHTDSGCSVSNVTSFGGQGNMDTQAAFSGFMTTSNCDVAASDQEKNAECSVAAPTNTIQHYTGPSYGTEFNKAGGGICAMEWTAASISIWFFPGNSTLSYSDFIKTPDPSTWSIPMVKVTGGDCDFATKFKDLKIIFDTSFCGQ
ncbi:hypothetical protein BCR34DRAFT_661807 [Clohesyomyces aquaticus]|uniref:GH16 domain-containing protein n=1 Tax=Clohesyomyces aquaticus TaxID=1231657 RepID=A0A1Y2A060_9PLEO|nr:hypothetical protein BCR34DRAFT_661807 [Clohesyomyces aquaticus]